MDINATQEDFAIWIAEIIGAEIIEKDSYYSYVFRSDSVQLELSAQDDDLSDEESEMFSQQEDFTLKKSDLLEAIQKLQTMSLFEELTLAGNKFYEVLLREESSFPRIQLSLREKGLSLEDKDNLINYLLSGPSNEYILFLIWKGASVSDSKALTKFIPRDRFRRVRQRISGDMFEILRNTYFRFMTLRLESARNRTTQEFERFSSAYLFQLSYNLNVALVPQRHLDEILRTGRIADIRRSSLRDIEAPRRHYIPDLIYHYQLAVAAENPFLEFLSYYHIIEHFFEEVFNEDLEDRVRNRITHPDFSYKRKKDIRSLIKEVGRYQKQRNNEFTFSEQEALRITLEKYLDIPDLTAKLVAYESSLIAYYRENKVAFAAADEVDLEAEKSSIIIHKLTRRIYKTRNSIVHSKESDNKERYTPFQDDRILVKEIPLLRFISEQIIIGTSKLIE